MKRIGIITSGGDCGGLNAIIKGATQMAQSMGIETVIIPNGYAGLYNLIDMDKLVVLTPERINLIDADVAGSEAGHSRVKIKKIEDPAKYERIKKGLQKFKIDGLVISGGDDTGSVMVDLAQQGIACVHAPKTMDLDLQSYSVGGDSAINRIAVFTRELKTTGMSHNRIIVLEAFGRYAGHTALRGGIGAEADCILIPEIPVDFDIVYEHMKRVYTSRVEKSDVKAGTYAIVVSEGITDIKGEHIVDESAGKDAFGHKKLAGAGKYARKQLETIMKNDPEMKEFMKCVGMFVPGVYELPEIREVTPGHLVRSGHTSAFDVNFGKEAGAAAVIMLTKGLAGNTVIKVRGTKIFYKSTAEVIKQRHVDLNTVALYEQLGICFGRKPGEYKPELVEEKGVIERSL
ncbi:MAG: 6-phosphofructokinase [Nitrospirae bacterium RIFCSPHIGHO2_02_FULL_40_19]|nr:MAG: 6-phosphofructokinase [Nitrospirae bacterium RIFCSPHIGHO2_02_FULL_40_19]